MLKAIARVWKESGRLVCSCGYQSQRRGWNEMAEHLMFRHGVSPVGISYHLARIWTNKVEWVEWGQES